GQNIYPEELEDQLSSLPMVAESVVVQRGDKLVALVYPDYEEAKAMGLGTAELQDLMEQNRQAFNTAAPPYSRLSAIELQQQEFEKTPKKSIKRYLYQ
ncbi:MAG: long-chain fatty acid--CoA ligase, partial [Prevotella sp.]|nr:long-chain fatty acid--CoA ligase [Prevotella sp.]